MCIRVSTPLKNTTPSFLPPSSPLNRQTVQAPHFIGNPPSILLFREPSWKLDFSMNPKNVKISQFEFLVMTMKIIFADQLFLSLNISDFNLLFMWKLQPPPWKKSPPLSQQPPPKVEVLSSPPFQKFGWRLNSPIERGWEGCTLWFPLPSCSHLICPNLSNQLPWFKQISKGWFFEFNGHFLSKINF